MMHTGVLGFGCLEVDGFSKWTALVYFLAVHDVLSDTGWYCVRTSPKQIAPIIIIGKMTLHRSGSTNIKIFSLSLSLSLCTGLRDAWNFWRNWYSLQKDGGQTTWERQKITMTRSVAPVPLTSIHYLNLMPVSYQRFDSANDSRHH